MDEGSVTRSSVGFVSVFGMVAGLIIAVGLPGLVFVFAPTMSTGLQAGIIIIAVLVGGLLSIVSAFFGLVMPSKIGR